MATRLICLWTIVKYSVMIAGGFIGWIIYVILFTFKSCINPDVFEIPVRLT